MASWRAFNEGTKFTEIKVLVALLHEFPGHMVLCRNDHDIFPSLTEKPDQRGEVAVAGEKQEGFKLLRHRDSINGDLHIEICFPHISPSEIIGLDDLERFRDEDVPSPFQKRKEGILIFRIMTNTVVADLQKSITFKERS